MKAPGNGIKSPGNGVKSPGNGVKSPGNADPGNFWAYFASKLYRKSQYSFPMFAGIPKPYRISGSKVPGLEIGFNKHPILVSVLNLVLS